jgi:hypothetical protein
MLLKENEYPTCATCIYSKLTNSIHRCIYRNPTALPLNEHEKYDKRAWWPIVRPDDVCGKGKWFVERDSSIYTLSYIDILFFLEEGE